MPSNSTGGTGTTLGGVTEAQETDPRTMAFKVEVVYADLDDDSQKVIIEGATNAITKYIFAPTRKTASNDEVVDRPLLEREVERTSMIGLSEVIKKHADEKLGPCWHAAYGRSFATFVTHERMSFIHFRVNDADIVVWKHG
mmetsp:Transcript_46035/g.141781  ORF Transcript_46035/g.141781 Transcript_46035/m.141781 type:complete len:141 (-) Transcript_46035:44-466(-)